MTTTALDAPPAAPVPPARGTSRGTRVRVVVFGLLALAVALVRLRTSPAYPADNDLNSDVYVYQAVGTAWAHGHLPYRDVFDVKGPVVYLLFRGFAEVRPFSMVPVTAFLALLALMSLLLAQAVARLWLASRAATASAVVVGVLVYLGPAGVVSSFTCEELAVPGVLLLLWLTCRLLLGRPVPAAWWLLDGAVLGLLFWAKFLVVAPWAALLVGLSVAVALRLLPATVLARLVGLHLAGAALATVAVLLPYHAVLPQLADAYFLAKGRGTGVGAELSAELDYVGTLLQESPAACVTLLAVLVVLVLGMRRVGPRVGVPLVVGYVLSLWASVAMVRHVNNLFVPLTYTAVAVPWLLAAAAARGRAALRGTVAVVAALTALAVTGPMVQSVSDDHLLGGPERVRCRSLATPSPEPARWHTGNLTTVFAAAARQQPVLSPGTLLSARTASASHQVVTRPFQFVDRSWAARVGADAVQTRYVQDRTFPYVWLHVVGFRSGSDVEGQLAAGATAALPGQPGLADALQRGYRPVLSCGNDVLLRAR